MKLASSYRVRDSVFTDSDRKGSIMLLNFCFLLIVTSFILFLPFLNKADEIKKYHEPVKRTVTILGYKTLPDKHATDVIDHYAIVKLGDQIYYMGDNQYLLDLAQSSKNIGAKVNIWMSNNALSSVNENSDYPPERYPVNLSTLLLVLIFLLPIISIFLYMSALRGRVEGSDNWLNQVLEYLTPVIWAIPVLYLIGIIILNCR
jgi:di/tricarboxylate transporter